MPRPERPTSAQRASTLLEEAQNTDLDPGEAAVMRQEATVLAMLAIAEQLDGVRDTIGSVRDALTDNDNYGAGTHLHYISDWLERISGRS